MSELIISKSSRLGKYYDWLDYMLPDAWRCSDHWRNLNLCQFVRRLVLWTVVNLFLYGAFFVFLGLIVFCLGYTVYWPFGHGWVLPPDKTLAGVALSIGAAVWLVVFVLMVIFGVVCFVDWIRANHTERGFEGAKANGFVAKPRKPSLVWEWLKAKKQKVCPLIKVVD